MGKEQGVIVKTNSNDDNQQGLVLFSTSPKQIKDLEKPVNEMMEFRPETSTEYAKLTKLATKLVKLRTPVQKEIDEKKRLVTMQAKQQKDRIEEAGNEIIKKITALEKKLIPAKEHYQKKKKEKEKREKKRIEAIENKLDEIRSYLLSTDVLDSNALQQKLEELEKIEITEEAFEEKYGIALKTKEDTVNTLKRVYQDRLDLEERERQAEADRLELEKQKEEMAKAKAMRENLQSILDYSNDLESLNQKGLSKRLDEVAEIKTKSFGEMKETAIMYKENTTLKIQAAIKSLQDKEKLKKEQEELKAKQKEMEQEKLYLETIHEINSIQSQIDLKTASKQDIEKALQNAQAISVDQDRLGTRSLDVAEAKQALIVKLNESLERIKIKQKHEEHKDNKKKAISNIDKLVKNALEIVALDNKDCPDDAVRVLESAHDKLINYKKELSRDSLGEFIAEVKTIVESHKLSIHNKVVSLEKEYEAMRAAELAPDKDKLAAYMEALASIKCAELKSGAAQELLKGIHDSLDKLNARVKTAIESM